jgi:cytochrome c553
MKGLLIALASALVLGTAPMAAQAQAKVNKSIALNGSFHRAHINKAKLDCGTCHGAKTQTEMLVLSTNRTHSTNLPGPVDPAACLACHKNEGKLGWYGKVK